jgi:hypothetical protein
MEGKTIQGINKEDKKTNNFGTVPKSIEAKFILLIHT